MPPCTSVAVRATKVPTSARWALAWQAVRWASSGTSLKAWPAYQTSARQGSKWAAISAHMCLTAWKEPMGRLNCSRSLA